jgi:hypothetical protein
MKDLQNITFLGGGPRSVREAAVGNGPLAVDARDNTARTKSLEISTWRSMRTVLCDVLENAPLLTDQAAGRESVI